jgi:hypothetical protein
MVSGVQEKLGIVNDGAVYAVFDFSAHNKDELSFCINDKLAVLRKGDDSEKEWWWARTVNNVEGYIPRNMLGVSLFFLYLVSFSSRLHTLSLFLQFRLQNCPRIRGFP